MFKIVGRSAVHCDVNIALTVIYACPFGSYTCFLSGHSFYVCIIELLCELLYIIAIYNIIYNIIAL